MDRCSKISKQSKPGLGEKMSSFHRSGLEYQSIHLRKKATQNNAELRVKIVIV